MSILNHDEIIEEYKNGFIICEPFDERHVSVNSLDVTIGNHFFYQNPKIPLYNIHSEKSVNDFWIKDEAKSPDELLVYLTEKYKGDNEKIEYIANILTNNITKDDKLIYLNANQRILGHTREFVGSRIKYTQMLKARSSIGRSMIEICSCAGSGDIGYLGVWLTL